MKKSTSSLTIIHFSYTTFVFLYFPCNILHYTADSELCLATGILRSFTLSRLFFYCYPMGSGITPTPSVHKYVEVKASSRLWEKYVVVIGGSFCREILTR